MWVRVLPPQNLRLNLDNMIYTEIKGDLFQHFQKIGDNTFILPADKNIAYAHCIANDGNYGAGIAPIFINQIFQSDTFVKRFLKENPWKGHGWSLCFNRLNGDHYLLEVELITKEFTYGKPTYETITEALKHLRLECDQYDISILRIPKIGCGLDDLDWNIVSSIIKNIFKDSFIDIEVYYL